MNLKRVVDWLSTKHVNGKSVCRDNLSSLLAEAEEMPCVCCFGDPDFLGMVEPRDALEFGVPEGDERAFFYMLCFACAKQFDKEVIFEKLQEFSIQMTN